MAVYADMQRFVLRHIIVTSAIIVSRFLRIINTIKEAIPIPFVPVPKDLSKVKTKVALGLTKRQLICFSLAGIIGVPVYLFTRGAIGNTAAMFLMMGLMLPFFFFAMFERDDQSAEKILRNILRARWFFPARRVYRTNNLYKYLETEGKAIANENQTAKTAGKTPTAKHKAGQRKPGRA
jgi:hypothetical protein